MSRIRGLAETHVSPHVDEAQPLANVIADDNDVRVQESPVVGT